MLAEPYQHEPQNGTQLRTTWSFGLTRWTPAPTASTTPAPSWPSTQGSGIGRSPVMACRSLWHTPLAPRRTSTSPSRGSRTASGSTESGSRTAFRTAAWAVGMGHLLLGVANNYGGSALRGKGSCGAAPNGSVSRSTLACPGRCHAARVMAAPRLDFGTRGIGPGGRHGTCSRAWHRTGWVRVERRAVVGWVGLGGGRGWMGRDDREPPGRVAAPPAPPPLPDSVAGPGSLSEHPSGCGE